MQYKNLVLLSLWTISNVYALEEIACEALPAEPIIFIHQQDFDPSGQTPYVINNPGIYKLAENITYNPLTSNTAAISINSSNVLFDLQDFMLQQGNAVANTDGLIVNAGTINFVIKKERFRTLPVQE